MPSRLRRLAALPLALAALAAASSTTAPAEAFCGFYVAGADAKLYNNATVVVLMREGTRTVLSMQNNYQGPPQDFAMVVPVPIVLQKENVKTLPRDVFDRVDTLAAPRLVEYWEQDPCQQEGIGLGSIGGIGTGQGFGSGGGRLGGSHATVKIEARFEVGEYEIVVLSATESSGLDAWLRENNYRIPEGAEPVLRPYVQAGMYFFVARVNAARVRFDDKGMATLSPLRFHYDSNTFSLPVRLGLLNSPGTQDLLVHVIADDRRYEAANYPNLTIPTNLDVREAARDGFGSFYAALLDEALRRQPGSVVTEYAWAAGSCDPCPGPTLTPYDLATLGADVLPSSEGSGVTGPTRPPGIRMGAASVKGALPPEIVHRIVRQNFGRFRLCYEDGLRKTPDLAGDVQIRFTITRAGEVAQLSSAGSSMKDKGVVACVQRAFQGLSFPQPEGGSAQVSMPISFGPSGGSAPGLSGRLASMVLTRLHLRYDRGALGEDLVLREAPAIVGGREVRADGALEQGAKPAERNNFQARYAIRHPWTGPIACDKPVRGVWGGPPEGAESKPKAGRDLAFAQRGASLDAFLTAALPAQATPPWPAASAAPAPAPASAAPGASAAASPGAQGAPAQGCGGCAAGGGATPAQAGALAAAGAALGLARRRRRRR